MDDKRNDALEMQNAHSTDFKILKIFQFKALLERCEKGTGIIMTTMDECTRGRNLRSHVHT